MTEFVVAFDIQVAGKEMTMEALAGLLSRTFATRPFLCELMSIASSILEHNVDADPIAVIKRTMIGLTAQHAASVSSALGWISDEQAVQASGIIGIFVAGLWPIANPAASVRQVTQFAEFDCLKFDFEPQLNEFIQLVFAGFQVRAQ